MANSDEHGRQTPRTDPYYPKWMYALAVVISAVVTLGTVIFETRPWAYLAVVVMWIALYGQYTVDRGTV